MADLYGAPASPTSGHEHGELSTFLSQFIHNSSSSSSCFSFTNKNIHSFSSPPTEVNSDFGLLSQPEDGHRENLSGIDSSSGGFNFSSFVSTCVGGVDSDANDSEDPEAAEVPASSTDRPRTSSKRSRAAEIHNLSEKRRRSRINEKMKALQNLIPNSNKTDKASMLDEAIEYLKQLQLQVQMLTMRNGLSLHPMWLPGVLQPVQLPQAGMIFDEGNGLPNTSRGTETFSVNEEGSVRNSFNISHECALPNQPIAIPAANIGLPETRFGHEPLLHDHFTPFNSSSGKEICNDDTPHLHLDMNFIGKNPSTGMS